MIFQLLVGIKDENNLLVSITLKALSELVMILGAATVIGGKRFKLFTDGRPKSHNCISTNDNKIKLKDRNRGSPLKRNPQIIFGESSDLPERPSPDGGEDNSSSTTLGEVEVEVDGEDTENWSDWELSNEKISPEVSEVIVEKENVIFNNKSEVIPSIPTQQSLPDITTLDIKCNVVNARKDSKVSNSELDFFHDMEPVISKTQVLNINEGKNKFDVDDAVDNCEGWDDTFEDWGSGNEEVVET